MKTLLTLLVGLLLLFVLSIVLASELGGENVVLRTADAGGSTHETSLWVQDLDGSEWLRAGSTESGWYQRLVERPLVEVKRKDRWRHYRAIPTPHRTDEVNSAMARKYAWADWLVGLLRNPEDTVAIRLEPAAG
jgi:hypothetical protein